jgi:hypothetical protein
MTVDPTEPDTFQDRFREIADPEAPEADTAEQHAELRPHEDDPLGGREPGEAADADAADQARVVDLDEDDYR